jgi:trimethylamine--corrinoid protein Co-methyltransferase
MCDAQIGHEKTMTGMMAALAGANLIYGLGMIESGMTFDYGQLVMDNEIAKMIKFCVNGIPVNDETLSVEVTKEVGPFKDFLTHKNTFDNMRIQSQPKLMDRKVRAAWEAAGSKSLHERAMDEARRIMETHTPDPLPDGVAEKLRAIVEETEKEMGIK